MFRKAARSHYQTWFGPFVALVTTGAALADGVTTVFTYQGQLKLSGSPADGAYDMRFRLYDAATVGNQVGSMQVHDGVTNPAVNVVDGLFNVDLDFGGVFDGTALWLEIEVRPDGPDAYTTLQPRQPLTAAPFALFALNALDAGCCIWELNGSAAYYDGGNVGIGTNSPVAPLHVVGAIHSRDSASNGVHVFNPNAPNASVNLSWLNDVARIRYGGTGAGATNGLAIQGTGDSTKLRLLDNGDLGLGDDAPQARLHLRTSDLTLSSTALENDELIIEAQDAVMGLYSNNQGDWASAIALKEVNGGAVVDTWGIARRSSAAATGPSSLHFTYGPSDNYATNPAHMVIDSDGLVGIGTTTPAARLDVATSLPNDVIANFVKGLSNTNGVYVEMEGSCADCGTLRAVNTGAGAAVWARSESNGAQAPALVAQRLLGTGLSNAIAEFKVGNSNVAEINVDGGLRLTGGGELETWGDIRLVGGAEIRFNDGSVQSSAANVVSAGVSVNPPSISAGSNTVITVTVTGAAVGDAVVVNPGGNLNASYAISFARVSAADTVSIGLINPGPVTVDPGSTTWQFRIIK
ncbi:MAG: hypothetical protein CHACPFDD_01847 [Phycisphaerae bacterium]|nr:hypothetical protein [Phycisphaerae bacterium]